MLASALIFRRCARTSFNLVTLYVIPVLPITKLRIFFMLKNKVNKNF